MYQDLSKRHDWPVTKARCQFTDQLAGIFERISGNSLSPLGAQNKNIGAASRAFLYSTGLDFISMHAGNLSTNL